MRCLYFSTCPNLPEANVLFIYDESEAQGLPAGQKRLFHTTKERGRGQSKTPPFGVKARKFLKPQ